MLWFYVHACVVVDWDGVDGASLAKLAVDNPDKASKVFLTWA